jgi:hypothetical protein
VTFDWQTIAVVTIVAGAIAYLVGAAWRSIARRRRAAACGGCATCPSGVAESEPSVVEIGSLARSPSTHPGRAAKHDS